MRQPHDDVDAELVDQVLLDLAPGQVRVAVGVQQALRRRDERALAVDGDRAALEDHRDGAHLVTGVLGPRPGEGGVALPGQVLLAPGVEDPVDGDTPRTVVRHDVDRAGVPEPGVVDVELDDLDRAAAHLGGPRRHRRTGRSS